MGMRKLAKLVGCGLLILRIEIELGVGHVCMEIGTERGIRSTLTIVSTQAILVIRNIKNCSLEIQNDGLK